MPHSFKGPHEPAFPSQSRNNHETFNPPVWGLSKREFYAAHALKGVLASNVYGTEITAVQIAVRAADLLIRELQK